MADHADLKGRVLFTILALEGAEHNSQARALHSAGELMRELWQAYERERGELARAVDALRLLRRHYDELLALGRDVSALRSALAETGRPVATLALQQPLTDAERAVIAAFVAELDKEKPCDASQATQEVPRG